MYYTVLLGIYEYENWKYDNMSRGKENGNEARIIKIIIMPMKKSTPVTYHIFI